MSDQHKVASEDRKYDFQAFPENLELARNIEERLGRRSTIEVSAAAQVQEIADLQRYMTELYADVRYGNRDAAMRDCINIATSAFIISRANVPEYYEEAPGDDPLKFVKKMGDAIAMNEIDLDLGSNRWTLTADLIIDMLGSINVLTGTLALEIGNVEGYNPDDLNFNVLTSCGLIAAYAQIVYQCAKNGSYRGQILQDMRPAKAV